MILTKYYQRDKIKDDETCGHVATTGPKEMHTEFGWSNLKERNHFEDLSVHWRLTLKWILRKYN